MRPRTPGSRRRAFTLIEAVIVVLALGISIPTTLVWLSDANDRRADSVTQTRATALATLVMEHVLADVSSKVSGLGFTALDNAAVYVDDPSEGLRVRLSPMTSLYTGMGISYSVDIGGLVDKAGAASGDATQDLFRLVTVTVSFTDSEGAARNLELQSMVAAL